MNFILFIKNISPNWLKSPGQFFDHNQPAGLPYLEDEGNISSITTFRYLEQQHLKPRSRGKQLILFSLESADVSRTRYVSIFTKQVCPIKGPLAGQSRFSRAGWTSCPFGQLMRIQDSPHLTPRETSNFVIPKFPGCSLRPVFVHLYRRTLLNKGISTCSKQNPSCGTKQIFPSG